jgi:raffinose/stachyose/melibiose transport system permease protein
MAVREAPAVARQAGRKRRRGGGYGLFLVPGLLSLFVVIIVPFIFNTYVSLTRWQGIGKPIWAGLDNYTQLFQDAVFWSSFKNNLILIVAMVVIPTALGILLAGLLFDVVVKRFGRRTASSLRAAYYLPQVLPIAVAGVVWGWILNPSYGALNAFLEAIGLDSLAKNWLGDPSTALLSVSAVMVWFQLGYPVVIFMAGLQRVDPELYEAAELDGASWLQRFRHVTVHQIQPEIFVVVLTTLIASLKVFAQIYVLTRGGPGTATIVPSYFAYQNYFEKANVGYGAAISTVLALIIVVISFGFITMQNRRERELMG